MHKLHSRLVGALALLTISVLGCSGPSNPVATTSGTVTMDGKPLPDLVITFTPVAGSDQKDGPGKSATGNTGADGKFKLSTYEMGDGAIVGKHKVTVFSSGVNPTPPGKLPEDYTLEVKPGSNDFDIQLTK